MLTKHFKGVGWREGGWLGGMGEGSGGRIRNKLRQFLVLKGYTLTYREE